MDENPSQGQNSPAAEEQKVGFPGPKKNGKKGKLLVIILIVILLLIAGTFTYFVLQGGKSDFKGTGSVSPTEGTSPTSTPIPTSINTKDKSDLTVEVLNGTGIAGEAGSLRTKLISLGYSGIEVGNADDTSYVTTEVYFSDSVSVTDRNELQKELEKIYQKVEVQNVTSPSVDIRIIIGYKKGATATATPTIKPTGSATPTAGASATVTTSPTPTTSQ